MICLIINEGCFYALFMPFEVDAKVMRKWREKQIPSAPNLICVYLSLCE